MNGGDALVATLLAHGCDTGFCVPGESYLAILAALRRERARFRLITNRHEAGVTFAAEAYAKLTTKPGIAFVTRGPGATNAAIGLHTADQDSSPLVLFIGQVPSAHLGLEAFQEIDYARMYGAIAKAVIEPKTPAEVADATALALTIAGTGRPGPVVVSLPEDITEGEAGDPAIPDPRPRPVTPPDPSAVAEAAALITKSRHPIIISGEMVSYEGAHEALRDLASASGAGVIAAFRRQDSFPNHDGAYLGHYGLGRAPFQRRAWADCDLVIAAGSRLDAITTEDFSLLRDDQKLIHIHVDPAVIGKTSPAHVAMPCDVGAAMSAIAAALPPPPDQRLAWRDRVHQDLRAFMDESPEALGDVDMAVVIKTLAARLQGVDHIIANDGGNFASWVHRYFPYSRPYSQVAPSSGAMGAGVPGALAAKIARPDATVIGLAGDGGFLMTGQELATAMLHDLAIKLIVCDNSAYGTILMHQHRAQGAEGYHGVELRSPDFAALARAYGAAAWTVEKTDQFAAALDDSLAHDGPTLIHLKTDIRDISAYGPLAD
ncbi:MAG: thiamine pyrophosphate-binding protein [Planctomycetes bacterium]|nr:thiamine pyrophosphate-binding protein [Planctomycetota bacterium]